MPSANYKAIRKENPDVNLSSIETFVIEDKTLVTIPFLEKLYGLSRRQIGNWQTMGMEKSEYSQPRLVLFDLAYVMKWKQENIKESYSRRTDGVRGIKVDRDGKADERDLPIDEVSKDEAERRQMILKAKNEEIKLKEAQGELVKAEDTDKAMAEQAAIHVAQYQNDLKLFPIILANKSQGEIKEIIDEHYEERIRNLNKLIHKVFDIPETVHDMILEIIENLNMGIKASVVMSGIKKMRELGGKKK